MWKAEIFNGKIHVDTGGYSKAGVAWCRKIPGGTFYKEKRRWVYPLRWEVCTLIRQATNDLGEKLDIGPVLWDWAMEESQRQQMIPDVKSLERVELQNLSKVNPVLAEAARPFQTVGIAFGARNRQVLIADEPGLGKTLQTIGVFQEAGVTGPILVVAPKAAVTITWPAEISRWSNGDRYGIIGNHLSPAERTKALDKVMQYCLDNPEKRFWVLTSPEYVRFRAILDERGNFAKGPDGKSVHRPVMYSVPALVEMTWAGVVVDESHKTLAGSTGNKKKWSAQRVGLGLLEVRPDGIRCALSGTPFRGKKERLWGTLNWLRPDMYRSYWKWIDKHFVTYQDEAGWGQSPVTTGELKSVDGFYDEAKSVMIRRTKREVVPELPAKMYAGEPLDPNDPKSPVAVWLPMEGQQLKQYKQMLDQATAELEGGVLLANGILAEMTRLKQFANAPHSLEGGRPLPISNGSNKVEWIMEWLDERGHIDGEGTGKVIIASQFTSFLNMLSNSLGYQDIAHHILTGETNDKKRKEMQAAFQAEGGPKVFLLNTKAGGVSLTLDAADDVIIVDQTSIPDDQEQVEDRAHRISRVDHNVTIWYLASLGSIEEAIAATTALREGEAKAIIDGARGVEFMKQLLEYCSAK